MSDGGSARERPLTGALIVAAQPRLASFVRDGRLTRIPRRPSIARLLYAAIGTAFPADRPLTETEVNNHLRGVYDDVATLRRALVDHGELVRAADGSSYRRP